MNKHPYQNLVPQIITHLRDRFLELVRLLIIRLDYFRVAGEHLKHTMEERGISLSQTTEKSKNDGRSRE